MFCPKCGKQISDDATFCPSCGNRISNTIKSEPAVVNYNQQSPPAAGLHCPKCGGKRLQAVTDVTTSTSTQGGGYSGGKGCLGYLLFGPLGLLCGSCGNSAKTTTTNTTKHYWYCQDCGEKFRDPNELKQQFEQQRRDVKIIIGAGIISLILAVFVITIGLWPSIDPLIGGVLVFEAILCIPAAIVSNSRANKSEAEYNNLISLLKRNTIN